MPCSSFWVRKIRVGGVCPFSKKNVIFVSYYSAVSPASLIETLIGITMIEFQTYDVEMPVIDMARVRSWIEQVCQAHDRMPGNLVYQFCSDEHILDVNRQFLGHDYYTDIITFPYCEENRISGDMVISLDTVRSNAAGIGESYDRELHRVIIHGVLHLCGIDDKGPGEREVMERHENEALVLLDRML